MSIKNKIIGIAATLLLAMGIQSAKAAAGCALVLESNPKATATYGLTIVIYPKDLLKPIVTIGPGVYYQYTLSQGDQIWVWVDVMHHPCGSYPAINWGHYSWYQCGIPGGFEQIWMAANYFDDYYQAEAICNCPAAGSGKVRDLQNGDQCSPAQLSQ